MGLGIIAVGIAVWGMNSINKFNKKEIKVQETLSGVQVALAKRYDMLTKMMEVTKT